MNSKLDRNYTDWEYIGELNGAKDFPQSPTQFQDMFCTGEYYAKFDENSDCWLFSMDDFGKFRYPHYTVKYTGNGEETTREHFTYADEKGCAIYPSNLPKSDAKNRFNQILDDLIMDYPEVIKYLIID
jgi:hypothetical protein